MFLVAPLAAAGAYVSAIKSSVTAQQFINRALIFYWLSLALVIPGVFALLALRISPICLN